MQQHQQHQQHQQQQIDYFRRCYRADSYDLSISNIDKIRSDRRLFFADEDVLACGVLPRLPVADDIGLGLQAQADTYRKERLLIYGCLMIKGELEAVSGFGKQRQLYSPLMYFPASLISDDDLYLHIDRADLRINTPLLRLLLKTDVDAAVTDSFPAIAWPITREAITHIGRWLREYTVVLNIEELARWPMLTAGPESVEGAKADVAMRIVSSCCLLLADRSRGSRGVLHELNELLLEASLSAPLQALLSGQIAAPVHGVSQADLLPGLLSAAQQSSLENAATYPLSLISGPPGTGKSFTIAAIAIDRMLQGESVLIVSKSDQAMDVIDEKLKSEFGLRAGYVHGADQSFLKTMKAYLDTLLKEGVAEHGAVKNLSVRLKKTQSDLLALEAKFIRLLWAVKHTDGSSAWYHQWVAKAFIAVNGLEALWSSQDEIGQKQDQFERHAEDYINAYRASKLKAILHEHRDVLVKFHQGLRSRSSKHLQERFQKTDFAVVLEAFPVWLVSLDEINKVLPFTCSLFDVVIVDESTQCDIASALPALQRAKRAVVVGDAKQLRHVSFLSRAKQGMLWQKAGLPDPVEDGFSYRDQSLMDFISDAIPTQAAVSLLDEHFRSKPELIAFSNEHFYAGRLKIMQARPGLTDDAALRFVKIDGKRSASGRNSAEKDAVVDEISRHIHLYENMAIKPSIGVLSPFRDQAEFLEKAINKQFTAQQRLAFNIRVSTPYGFQGEERDVMLLSFAIDNDSARAAAYLNREDVFNVSITRAKQRQVIFYSVDERRLTENNLFRHYLSYDHNVCLRGDTQALRCEFAEALQGALVKEGIDVWLGYDIAGQQVDVVCAYNGNIIGIDLVGYTGEFEDYFSLQSYKTLHRAGIDVIPMPYSLWVREADKCLNLIRDRLGKLPKRV